MDVGSLIGVIVFSLILFGLGVLMMYKTEALYDITWYKRANANEEIKERVMNRIALSGLFAAVFSIIYLIIGIIIVT